MVHKRIERRRAAKIDAILDTALGLVERRGLDGLTVAALAAELDWTKGALYRYFASKDQLVAALNRRVLSGWSAELQTALADRPDLPPLGRLELAMATWIHLAHERPAELGLVSMSLADPRDLVADLSDATHLPVMLALLQQLTGFVAEATERGELTPGDPVDRVLRLVFAVQGLLQLRKLARFDPVLFDTRALASRTVSDLITAWKEAP